MLGRMRRRFRRHRVLAYQDYRDLRIPGTRFLENCRNRLAFYCWWHISHLVTKTLVNPGKTAIPEML